MATTRFANRALPILMFLGCGLTAALAQNTNEIISIDPASAEQGTLGLTLTFTLDSDTPPPPPGGILPDSVMLGGLTGAAITHSSQSLVTAVFDIPGDEPLGNKPASITFTTPNGTLTFSLADGFEVTSGATAPPGIAQNPISQRVTPGSDVTFSVVAYGAEPLSYQWQKDSVDLTGETTDFLQLIGVMESDSGEYGCVVTNAYGVASSDPAVLTVAALPIGAYPIVDTAQLFCYDNAVSMTCPMSGTDFSGQDAQLDYNLPTYMLSGDGLTVYDEVTGLTWQRSPDTDDDGDIDYDDKLTLAQAQDYPAALNAISYGGFTDWRLPTIKELYSLIDFNGMDPTTCETEADCPGLTPFIDTTAFDFAYGDTSAGERVIDSQYASSTQYVSILDGELLFGVNFADGRIKGYWLNLGGSDKTFLVICVRGNPDYGVNNLVPLSDDTILDRATGLEWQRGDSGVGLLWKAALEYAELTMLDGHSDWRVPHAKELQSIFDYTRSPDTTSSAAIDPLFDSTAIVNEESVTDYPYYWTSTTHIGYLDHGDSAVYMSFGRGLGYMNGAWQDVHGAGCQRSDPKIGDPNDYPTGHGPQGDAIRIYNHVRLVRGPFCPQDVNQDGAIDAVDFDLAGDCLSGPENIVSGTCAIKDFDLDLDVDIVDMCKLQVSVGLTSGNCK